MSWDRRAEQEKQHNGLGSKQTEENAQQLQGEVAEEQGQIKESSRQEEEQQLIPEPADSSIRKARARKDYEPRLHLLRQKRELEKERERAERERAEQEKQRAEAERRLKEQQQMEALRLADQRPLLPPPDDSANLARVLTQLQKGKQGPTSSTHCTTLQLPSFFLWEPSGLVSAIILQLTFRIAHSLLHPQTTLHQTLARQAPMPVPLLGRLLFTR